MCGLDILPLCTQRDSLLTDTQRNVQDLLSRLTKAEHLHTTHLSTLDQTHKLLPALHPHTHGVTEEEDECPMGTEVDFLPRPLHYRFFVGVNAFECWVVQNADRFFFACVSFILFFSRQCVCVKNNRLLSCITEKRTDDLGSVIIIIAHSLLSSESYSLHPSPFVRSY